MRCCDVDLDWTLEPAQYPRTLLTQFTLRLPESAAASRVDAFWNGFEELDVATGERRDPPADEGTTLGKKRLGSFNF